VQGACPHAGGNDVGLLDEISDTGLCSAVAGVATRSTVAVAVSASALTHRNRSPLRLRDRPKLLLLDETSVSGLSLLGVDNWVEAIFNGTALVIAVALSTVLSRRQAGQG
jgi:hypothetical protein